MAGEKVRRTNVQQRQYLENILCSFMLIFRQSVRSCRFVRVLHDYNQQKKFSFSATLLFSTPLCIDSSQAAYQPALCLHNVQFVTIHS